MKIDRHNYEEFFILYWDDELTAVEKQAVENFVNQHADLREEFEIIGEARFNPDAGVQFKDKDFLLNDSFINITNYEEQLLNYIDDEITGKEKKEVERFVGQHPGAQKELALFQKTKLQPEAEISFPDKSILYRREEKVRVISMTWLRVAVAAAIIIVAGLTVFQFVNSGNSVEQSQVANADTEKKTPVNNNSVSPVEQADNDPEKKTNGNGDKTETGEPKDKLNIKDQVENGAIAQGSINQDNRQSNSPTEETNLPTGTNDIVDVIDVISEKAGKVEINKTDVVNTSFTRPGVTNKLVPSLYIPEAEEKEKDGGGLKEFFRKTTRVFERRTKIQTTTEDNKLLVGAFAVSLK